MQNLIGYFQKYLLLKCSQKHAFMIHVYPTAVAKDLIKMIEHIIKFWYRKKVI